MVYQLAARPPKCQSISSLIASSSFRYVTEKMADYAPDVKRILRANGCYFHRQGKGDHEIWYSPITNRYFPVDSKILSRYTANGILKQAGLPKEFQYLRSKARTESRDRLATPPFPTAIACPSGA